MLYQHWNWLSLACSILPGTQVWRQKLRCSPITCLTVASWCNCTKDNDTKIWTPLALGTLALIDWTSAYSSLTKVVLVKAHIGSLGDVIIYSFDPQLASDFTMKFIVCGCALEAIPYSNTMVTRCPLIIIIEDVYRMMLLCWLHYTNVLCPNISIICPHVIVFILHSDLFLHPSKQSLNSISLLLWKSYPTSCTMLSACIP